MPKTKLTDKKIAQTRCPEGKNNITLSDTEVHGLVAEIRSSGAGTYYLRYQDSHGKRRHYRISPINGLNVVDARKVAREVNTKIAMGVDPKQQQAERKATPTVSSFVRESFLPYLESYKRDWSTDWSLFKNHVLPVIGDLHMDEVRRHHIIDLINRHAKGHQPGSTNRVIVLVRHLFSRAVNWEVPGMTKNPTDDIRQLANENQRQRFLSVDEIKRLMAAAEASQSPIFEHIIAMLLLTGARRNEVLHAQWADVDFNARQWVIPKNKSARPRYIPLSEAAIGLLDQIPRLSDSEYIFANPKTGKPYQHVHHTWDTIRKRAGLDDVRLHDLRHSFASLLVNTGHSLYKVQHLLGHARPVTTQRYAHLANETLMEATQDVGNLLESSFNTNHNLELAAPL